MDIVERVLSMDDRLLARVAAQAATEGVEVGSIRWSDIQREHLKIMLDAMTPDERSIYRQISEFGPGSFDLLQTPDLRTPA